MKKTKLIALVLLIAGSVGTAGITSCSNEDDTKNDVTLPDYSGTTPQTLIEDVDSGKQSWHNFYTEIIREEQKSNGTANTERAIYAAKQLKRADSMEQVMKERQGSNDLLDDERLFGYNYHSINYQSTDELGHAITLSELVIYPVTYNWFDKQADNIIIACHDIITNNEERPSSYNTTDDYLVIRELMQKYVDVKECLLVIPDYEGLGASSNRPQRFMSRDLTARQVISCEPEQ